METSRKVRVVATLSSPLSEDDVRSHQHQRLTDRSCGKVGDRGAVNYMDRINHTFGCLGRKIAEN